MNDSLTGVRANKFVINSTNFITASWKHQQGLSNKMFQFATLLGLAQQLNLEPITVASEHVLLEDVFDLKSDEIWF